MRTIWKYVIEPNSRRDDVFTMRLAPPRGAKPLCVGMQANVCCVWMEVDTDAPLTELKLYSVGTGHGMVPPNSQYVGTIFQGPYVWHIYKEYQA